MKTFDINPKEGTFTITCREIVAEVHARLAAKEWVHPEVMEIYHRIINNEL